MFDVNVAKVDKNLIIKWQLTRIEIPLSDILYVKEDNFYSGEVKGAIRIGFPYGTANRIVIQTKSDTYIIFTNVDAVKNKMLSLVSN